MNHFSIKAFRNSLFALSILFSPLTSSVAQDGKDSIGLPPLRSNAEKLAVLLQIKEKVPNLFSDAAHYDIDLFSLLEDEEKLIGHLKTNPKYLELFGNKEYYEIQITPAQEGFQEGELRIHPLAIQEWKAQLKNKLNQFKAQQGKGCENTYPMEVLGREISEKVQSIAQASPRDGNELLYDLGKIKANQLTLNTALKNGGAKTLSERLSKALKIYNQLPKKPAHFSQETLKQALDWEQAKEDLKSLIELYAALNRRGQMRDPTYHTWQTVEASLNELNSENLIAFHDKEDYLRPIINRWVPSPNCLQEEMLSRIHKTISLFASRKISSTNQATDSITISQQHPIFGIFRGCTGGDCSSRYSFPYPNDPHEKVFFILGKNKRIKGYVSATQVVANGRPSLYVITVSGNRVTSADTELIFRGLEKEKAKLGVEQILLPTPGRIESLINFSAPRSVYKRYTAHQPTVQVRYNHPEIRSEIQNFQSDCGYNQGQYDHMEQNVEAVVLRLKKNSENEEITTQIHELSKDPLPNPSLNSMSMRQVFEFLLDLKNSGRQELEEKILEIDYVKQSLNPEKYEEVTRLLFEGQFNESTTVQQFKMLLNSKLLKLDRSLIRYLEKNPTFFYPAILSCNDAFSPENIDKTAKYIIKYLKSSTTDFQTNNPTWSTHLEKHLEVLNTTERFQKFKEDTLNQLKHNDPTIRQNALTCLEKIKPSDLATHSKILQIGLQDSEKLIRSTALNVLRKIKPTHPKIHLRIANAIQYSNKSVKLWALDELWELKPVDPKVHLKIANALQDPDPDISYYAFEALVAIKPTDPKVHSEISSALEHSDKSIRVRALIALETTQPSDPMIHLKISQALQDSSQLVKIRALTALTAIKPTDLKIHLNISQALEDSDKEVRDSALAALAQIKPTHPDIHLKMTQVALHDSDRYLRHYAKMGLATIKPTDPRTHLEILQAALYHSESQTRLEALFLLETIFPSYPEIYSGISKIARYDSDPRCRLQALLTLSSTKLNDLSIHLEILHVALSDSSGDIRKVALKYLKTIQSPHPHVNKGLLQVAIYHKDPQERALAIQGLEQMNPTNRAVHESLRREILKHSNQINNRHDLLPLVHKIMIPHPAQKRINGTHYEGLRNFLSHCGNLKSLIEFFSDHFGTLGSSRSFSLEKE